MKHSTIRNLLLLCIFLDLALIGVVLWDYFRNDSDLIVIVLGVFAAFVVITAILFFAAGRGKVEERIVVKTVERHTQSTPLELTQVNVQEAPIIIQPTGDIQPPIPPAPLRTNPNVARVAPPRPVALRSAARPVNPVRKIGKRPKRRRKAGPFRYKGYLLHRKDIKLANGNGVRTIYFFAKKRTKSGTPSRKPRGHHVGVNHRTGLPFLMKGKGKDGENVTPAKRKPGYRPQCAALTDGGRKQCRNSARKGSKYCGSHVGYQPPTTKGLAKRIEGKRWSANDKRTDTSSVKAADTRPKVRKAPDTATSRRKPTRRQATRRPARRRTVRKSR